MLVYNIEITMTYYNTPIRMAKMKKIKNTNVGEEFSHVASKNMK